MSTCSPSGKRIGNVNKCLTGILLVLLLHSPYAMSSDSERNKSISDVYFIHTSGHIAQLDSGLAVVKTDWYANLPGIDIPCADVTPNGKEITICSDGYLYRIDADTLKLTTDKVSKPEGISVGSVFAATDDYVFVSGITEASLRRPISAPLDKEAYLWNLKTNEMKRVCSSQIVQQNVRFSPDHSYMYVFSDRDMLTLEWPSCNVRTALSLDSVFLSYDARGFRLGDLRGWEVDWKDNTHEFWCTKEREGNEAKSVLLRVKSLEDVRKVSSLFSGWPRRGLFGKANPNRSDWRTRIQRWNDTQDIPRWFLYDKITCKRLSRFGWEWFDDGARDCGEARLSPDGEWILIPILMEKEIPGAEIDDRFSPGSISNYRSTHDVYRELRAVETKTGRTVKAVHIGEQSTFVIRKR